MKAFICVCSPTLPNLCTGCSAGLKCVYYIFNIPYMSDCRTCTLLSILSSNTIKPSLTSLGRFYILFLSPFHLISTAIFKITLFYFISQFVCVSHQIANSASTELHLLYLLWYPWDPGQCQGLLVLNKWFWISK